MTSVLGILVLTYAAAIAETALVPALAVYQVTPSALVLLGIVWAVSAAPSPVRIVEVALVGLVFDFNSGSHAGVGMATFALLALVVMHVRGTMRRLGTVQQAVACVPLGAATMLVLGLANRLFGEPAPALPLVLWGAIATAVYTAALSLPMWMVVDWVRDARRARPAL